MRVYRKPSDDIKSVDTIGSPLGDFFHSCLSFTEEGSGIENDISNNRKTIANVLALLVEKGLVTVEEAFELVGASGFDAFEVR